jgi:hypothetical protein
MSTLENYDIWTQNVFQNLGAASKEGSDTVDFILQNSVGVVTVDTNATNLWWKVKFGSKGLQIQNTLYVSRFIASKESADPWALMEFVHETRHLQQGLWTAFSVYGEMEAWQLGFRFYKSLPNPGYLSPFVEQLLELPLSHDREVLKQARNLINLDQNGGSTFRQQVVSVLKRERSFNDVYWINALPLNPIFG